MDNQEKISNGMFVSKVESILGKGESQSSLNIDLQESDFSIIYDLMTKENEALVRKRIEL